MTNERVDEGMKMFSNNLSPFLKWPGGKSSEIRKISESAPRTRVNRFVEPFVGGGSVLLSIDSTIPAVANDVCPELIDLYKSGSMKDSELKDELLKLSFSWELIASHETKWEILSNQLMVKEIDAIHAVAKIIELMQIETLTYGEEFNKEFERRISKDLPSKICRMEKLQIEKKRMLPLDEFTSNIEGSIRAGFYMAVRNRYNKARLIDLHSKVRTADFLFLREYCYASMFRFNSKGEFNIPYGGISYNRKSFRSKIEKLFEPTMNVRLENTDFHCCDFQDFLDTVKLTEFDFVFVDPPYDSDFTDYDGREFRNKDQERLADYLNATPAKVMVVIGDTELIRSLYKVPKWRIQEDDLQYKWTIKSRNERAKTHLTITNY
jgi:DNA adenine methylase